MRQVAEISLTCPAKRGKIMVGKGVDFMKKYLISTNVDGHLYSNYTTERLMSVEEAEEELAYVREVDPNAKLVEVVEERRNNLATTKASAMPVDIKENPGLAVMRKIHLLREKVKEVEASKMEAGRQKYNYLSERTLTTTIRPVMQELGLVAVPVKSEQTTTSYDMGVKDGETRRVLLTEAQKIFMVMDIETGDSIMISVEGSGADTLDKGCNKAVTCATKNFYKDLLNLPSPERDDPDTTASPSYSNRGTSSYSANDPGSIQLKYGAHAGKTLRQLFDENPEEVEKLANGTSKWIAEKAQAFLNSLAA